MEKLKIIYEDKYIVVVDKPSNLLTIATKQEKENTLYHKVLMYEQNKHKNNRIFIVHRLDKDTSGLVVFAKDIKTKEKLQDNWGDVKRYYYAIVNGKTKTEETIKSYLKETKSLITYSTKDKTGKLAITKYKTIKQSHKYSLLDIEILTGRKNQIRVHMKDINHPIIGDKKYGLSDNKRLLLDAYKIILKHPITQENLILEHDIPNDFKKII